MGYSGRTEVPFVVSASEASVSNHIFNKRKFKMQPFFVYMLLCSDSSYYIGHTDDIEKRLSEHTLSTIESYTSTRLPVKLIYLQDFMTRAEAIEAEQQIKKWSRKKKEALATGQWEQLKKLSKKNFKK